MKMQPPRRRDAETATETDKAIELVFCAAVSAPLRLCGPPFFELKSGPKCPPVAQNVPVCHPIEKVAERTHRGASIASAYSAKGGAR